jgi:hypothetical protein
MKRVDVLIAGGGRLPLRAQRGKGEGPVAAHRVAKGGEGWA